MTLAERAAIRERHAQGEIIFDERHVVHRDRGKLLDYCERLERTNELQRAVIAENDADAKRLERERDYARELVRKWGRVDVGAWDAVDRWDAEDAQAKRWIGCPHVDCTVTEPHEHESGTNAAQAGAGGKEKP